MNAEVETTKNDATAPTQSVAKLTNPSAVKKAVALGKDMQKVPDNLTVPDRVLRQILLVTLAMRIYAIQTAIAKETPRTVGEGDHIESHCQAKHELAGRIAGSGGHGRP